MARIGALKARYGVLKDLKLIPQEYNVKVCIKFQVIKIFDNEGEKTATSVLFTNIRTSRLRSLQSAYNERERLDTARGKAEWRTFVMCIQICLAFLKSKSNNEGLFTS